ncbi:MAG: hypothetical protein WBM83_00140 [Flavobacteriaceae bacterium]
MSQNTEYPVFELGMLTANPAHIKQFEAGMAVHNKKYHSDDVYSARIYAIQKRIECRKVHLGHGTAAKVRF